MIRRLIAILLILLMFFSPLLGSKEPVLVQEVDEETEKYQQLLYYMGDSMIDRISNEIEQDKEAKIKKVKDIKTDIKGATKIGKLEYAEYLKKYLLVLNPDYILEKSETYLSDEELIEGLGMESLGKNKDNLHGKYKNYVHADDEIDNPIERLFSAIEVFYRKDIENENNPFNPWRNREKRNKFFGINETHSDRKITIKFYNNGPEYFKLEDFTLYGDDYFNANHDGNEVIIHYKNHGPKRVKLKNLAYQGYVKGSPKEFISGGADIEFKNENRNIFKTSFDIEPSQVIERIEIKFDKDIVGKPGNLVGRQNIKGRIFEIDYHGKLVRNSIYLRDLAYGKA